MTVRSIALMVLGLTLAMPSMAGDSAWPLPAAKPESVGVSSARLDGVTAFYERQVREQAASGYVVMVARHGKLVYAKAVGERNLEKHLPMTLDTHFRIASMTKPVTAVAVLMLYEEGRFQLDDPVARYLPEFANPRVATGVDAAGNLTTEPAKRPISIRHLLTHSSGIGYYTFLTGKDPVARAWSTLKFDESRTLAENVRDLATYPLYFHPGDGWQYSFADDVLGRLVEVLSGMPYDRFLQERLFTPLGMTHTGFYIPEAQVSMVATVYKHDADGKLVVSPFDARRSTDPVVKSPMGGGGLQSTAGDYLRFAQMLLNGGSFDGRQYLSPATVALMTSNQVPEDAMHKYWGADSKGLGFGLSISVILDAASSPQADCVGDFYWSGLLNTRWLASPRTGVIALVMNQLDRSGEKEPLRTEQDLHNLAFGTLQTLDTPAGMPACMAMR